jgi:hypothetical protein
VSGPQPGLRPKLGEFNIGGFAIERLLDFGPIPGQYAVAFLNVLQVVFRWRNVTSLETVRCATACADMPPHRPRGLARDLVMCGD